MIGATKTLLATVAGAYVALIIGEESMSLPLIEAEIRRFLSTSTSEVLCIKCKWGVGQDLWLA